MVSDLFLSMPDNRVLKKYQAFLLGTIGIAIILGLIFNPILVGPGETVIDEKIIPLKLISGDIIQISIHVRSGLGGFWVLSSSDTDWSADGSSDTDDSKIITVPKGGNYYLQVYIIDGIGEITVYRMINLTICCSSSIVLLILGIYYGLQIYKEKKLQPQTNLSFPVQTTHLPSQSVKYCYICGQVLPMEAFFCSGCGNQQQTYNISAQKSISTKKEVEKEKPIVTRVHCPKCNEVKNIDILKNPFITKCEKCGTPLIVDYL